MQIEMQKSESGGKNAVKEGTKTRSPKERAQNAENGSGGKNAAKGTLIIMTNLPFWQ